MKGTPLHSTPGRQAPVHRHGIDSALEAPAGETTLELGAVYRAYAPRVARWAGRLGGPSLDAEDTVQEVFLVVQRRLVEFRGDAELSTWLFRITENVVCQRRRKERLRRWLRGSAEEVAGELDAGAPSPIEVIERGQAAAYVYRILDGMTESYRTALTLFELEGLSGEQIAALTGTSVEAVWVRLHRARAQFLDRMKKLDKRDSAARAERTRGSR